MTIIEDLRAARTAIDRAIELLAAPTVTVGPAPVQAPAPASPFRSVGADSAPAPAPTQPPAPVPTPAPAPAPNILRRWNNVWTENWSGSLRVGGRILFEDATAVAPDAESDRGVGDVLVSPWVPLDGWAQYTQAGPSAIVDGRLLIDQRGNVPVALLSQRSLSKDSCAAETDVSLRPDAGAWVGLTLYLGEEHYREIGVAYLNGLWHATLHAPHYFKALPLLEPIDMRLRIEYVRGVGWSLKVGGREYFREPDGYRNNSLQARPHVGIFCVNLEAEKGIGDGYLRASIGTVYALE